MTSKPGPYSIGSDLWPGLSRLAEEAGEVIQVIGKLIGTHGDRSHFDGTDLRDWLTAELGDLQAAIAFVVDRNGLDWNAVNDRRALKRDTYEQWHQAGQRALLGEDSR
jgi:NTP pyrophosphatase (non-canonical NTP hydrolase)